VDPLFIRALWIGVAVLAGVVSALVAGIVSRSGGSSLTTAIRHGAVTFAASVTLLILILTALGLVI